MFNETTKEKREKIYEEKDEDFRQKSSKQLFGICNDVSVGWQQ